MNETPQHHPVKRQRYVPVVVLSALAIVMGIASPAVAASSGFESIVASSELGYRIGRVAGGAIPILVIVFLLIYASKRKSRPKQ